MSIRDSESSAIPTHEKAIFSPLGTHERGRLILSRAHHWRPCGVVSTTVNPANWNPSNHRSTDRKTCIYFIKIELKLAYRNLFYKAGSKASIRVYSEAFRHKASIRVYDEAFRQKASIRVSQSLLGMELETGKIFEQKLWH